MSFDNGFPASRFGTDPHSRSGGVRNSMYLPIAHAVQFVEYPESIEWSQLTYARGPAVMNGCMYMVLPGAV